MNRRIALSLALAAATLSAAFAVTAPQNAERPGLLAEAPEIRVSPLPAHRAVPLGQGQSQGQTVTR